MQLVRLLKTTTFRVALIYMLLFAVSVVLLLAFIYWSTADFMTRQTEETLNAEIRGLSEQFGRLGLPGLVETIKRRSRNPGDSLYLLTGPAKIKLAGNLNRWPEAESRPDGWITFTYRRRVLGEGEAIEERMARGRVFRVRNTFFLLVARDVHERTRIERSFLRSLFSAMVLMIVLGVVGGIVISRNIMRRLEEVNQTSRDIISGDLTRRVPVKEGSRDELDQLAGNLNAMLDQIERLMNGMRAVTDNVAHDLRSPLNRIRSRIEVTLMQSRRPEELRTALERTMDEVDAVIGTFNALLSIARVEAGSRREDFADVDLKAVLDDVVELYAPVAEDKPVTLSVDAQPVPAVRGNRELISQALANLIDNAIKYTGAGGSVLVSLRALPPGADGRPRAEIAVADSGPGIAADDRGRVLERFVRLESSRNMPGSGLGLSLVHAVARMHGAKLELADGLPRGDGCGLKAALRFAAPGAAGKA